MYSKTLKPGILFGPYPEKQLPSESSLDTAILQGVRKVTALPWLQHYRAKEFATSVEIFGELLANELPIELMRRLKRLREELCLHGASDGADEQVLVEAFAVVRELSGRILNMRHYHNQIMGGWLILNGMLAEMATGEGKTLTAALPASIAALAGTPVHVLTTNDYLACRDAEQLSPLYAVLGLTVGSVTGEMEDPAVRRAGYACDITYTTNKQVGFDYLRDRTRTGSSSRLSRIISAAMPEYSEPVLRGMCFGIVDEADSVLIDEARTPLKLSRQVANSPPEEFYTAVLSLADNLLIDKDYTVSAGRVDLTAKGKKLLKESCEKNSGLLTRRRNREESVRLALSAKHLYKRDEHYLVADGKVHIIDPNTGRRMAGRTWERGLHQLIETREGLDVSPFTETIGKISYQQLFSRYLSMGAMSGTASQVKGELLAIYRLPVVCVPCNQPLQRNNYGGKVFKTHEEKLLGIVESVKEIHATGRPVLIGTRTVSASEELSALLDEAGFSHRVLNARQDADEAEVVGRSGQAGSITIATNMAGRGTDISLGAGVAELGGLHVIVSEHNDVYRLDRQLIGRCGRQGDPGSYQIFLCWDYQIVMSDNVRIQEILLNINNIAAFCCVRLAQYRQELQQRRLRKRLTNSDQSLAVGLSFSGSG